MYLYSVCLLPSAISEMSAQAARTGKITLADRYGLMAAILEEKLSYEERCAVNRLLWALVRGRLTVVSDLSTEIVYSSESSSVFSSKSTQMSASVSQDVISNQLVSPPRS